VRVVAEHLATRGRPCASGDRRRPADTRQSGADPGIVRPGGPSQGDRHLGRARRGGDPDRSVPGWLSHRPSQLAVDLPDQRSTRRLGALGGGTNMYRRAGTS
jgi:hypothetical protein